LTSLTCFFLTIHHANTGIINCFYSKTSLNSFSVIAPSFFRRGNPWVAQCGRGKPRPYECDEKVLTRHGVTVNGT
jgi:hypothetical protein